MPALDVEVLAHADLLAVEEHRRAGQGEQQAVDHPDPPRVAVRASAAAGGAGRGRRPACSGSGPNAANTSWRSSSVSLSRVSSSWLRTKVAHWRVRRRSRGRAVSASASGPASCRASDRYSALHADEVELHGQLVAVASPPKNCRCCSCGRFTSPSRIAVAGPAAEERAQLAQVLVRVAEPVGVGRVDARRSRAGTARRRPGSPSDAELQPEAHDLGDLVAHLRVGDVEVGLVR